MSDYTDLKTKLSRAGSNPEAYDLEEAPAKLMRDAHAAIEALEAAGAELIALRREHDVKRTEAEAQLAVAEEVIAGVRNAWERQGPMPHVHRKEQARVVQLWPTLADAVKRAVDHKPGTDDGMVLAPRATLSYAAGALEGSGDNSDRYCASQIRAALSAAHSGQRADWARVGQAFVKPPEESDGK